MIEKIKAATHNRFLLASRIGVFDGLPYRAGADGRKAEPWPCSLPYRHGFGVHEQRPQEPDLPEPKRVIALLKQSGVGLINVSMGNPYTNPHIGRPFEKPDEGNYQTPEHPLIGVDRHFRLCGGNPAGISRPASRGHRLQLAAALAAPRRGGQTSGTDGRPSWASAGGPWPIPVCPPTS